MSAVARWQHWYVSRNTSMTHRRRLFVFSGCKPLSSFPLFFLCPFLLSLTIYRSAKRYKLPWSLPKMHFCVFGLKKLLKKEKKQQKCAKITVGQLGLVLLVKHKLSTFIRVQLHPGSRCLCYVDSTNKKQS